MCGTWLDWLSRGFRSSSPGPDGLFDFFFLIYHYLIKKIVFFFFFLLLEFSKSKETIGGMTSLQGRNKASRFVSELMLAALHRYQVACFRVLLYGASYTCMWKHTISVLPV